MEDPKIQEEINRVKSILNGDTIKTADGLVVAKYLINKNQFGWARRLLDTIVERTRTEPVTDTKLHENIIQKRALATYKDSNLNRSQALDRALEILSALGLQKTQDHETLGLAGAIYKRKWEVDARESNLEISLKYYRRGYEAGVEGGDAYPSINAAFIQDLLANIEDKQAREAGSESTTAPVRRQDSIEIRSAIVNLLSKKLTSQTLTSDHYWPVVTLAEAYFGLRDYTSAKTWLMKAREFEKSPWEFFSSAKQLVQLAEIHADEDARKGNDPTSSLKLKLEDTEAWNTLIGFLGSNATALRTLYLGKVGLALSGGGFRASLYHIGVMAKLSELDLLRHIEVLSCVSGGSILGAHYYLELRRMYRQGAKDSDLGRDDYVNIVNNLIRDFVAGVQENPRVRVLANPWSNLKMLFFSSYSRTKRLGELYEELIYKKVDDGESGKPRYINDLYIYPIESNQDFNPRRDNWSRAHKVPELVLNATTLNTGHNWQFTAAWMGESSVNWDPEVNKNDLYRGMYYHEAPAAFRKVRLGDAVGASSCVPGLFEPIVMEGLFPDATLRLVDGGVYDNLGVASLLEQDCTVVIASDATGQLPTDNDPGSGGLNAVLRSNSILMERVRGTLYQNLNARRHSSVLKGFAYTHLKWGLESRTVDWIDCEDPPETELTRKNIVTPYGIRNDIQRLLAGMRTDLDSFTDVEAFTLMTSGYHAMGKAVGNVPAFDQSVPELDWEFLKVAPGMMMPGSGHEQEHAALKAKLAASHSLFFKVWKLSRLLKYIAIFIAAALAVLLFYLLLSDMSYKPLATVLNNVGEHVTSGFIFWTLATMVFSYLAVAWFGTSGILMSRLVNFRNTLRRMLVGIGMGIIGWLGAWIHLRFFDKLFKKIGKVE